MEAIREILYGLDPPQRTRDRPMLVLALGLSRSGTDSLRSALLKLEYNGVYHGFVCTASQREDSSLWNKWMRQKLAGGSGPTSAKEFDQILGTFEAVTDAPCNVFSTELIDAYPDAKVILNRRANMDAWYKSMKVNFLPQLSGPFRWLSFFDAQMYGLWWTFWLSSVGYAKGDFELYGKQTAQEHYATIEKHLQSQGREYLNWTVEEGWEPLCKFLDKELPAEAFPNQNAGGQFEEKMEDYTKDMAMNAFKNIAIIAVGIAGVAVGVYLKFQRS